MFGFGKKKNTCKSEALSLVTDVYQNVNELIAIITGQKEAPEDYDLADIQYSLVQQVNALTPALSAIVNCEEFSDIEGHYWGGHLNQFGAFCLKQANDLEGAIEYIEASLTELNSLYSFVNYPYYDIPNLLEDVNSYTLEDQGPIDLLRVRRIYTSMISELGDEEKTTKEIENNVDIGRENFAESPDSFITFAETLWNASYYFSFDDNDKSVNYLREAIDLLESRADLETHMANNDLTLLRYKLSLFKCISPDSDEAINLENEIKPLADFFEAAEKWLAINELPLQKGYWSPERLIMKKFAEIHQFRSHLEQTSSEYTYEESLELVTKNLTDIDELIKDVRKNDASTYFVPHLIAFKAYIHARMSDNDSAAKLYKEAQKLCEEYEKENSFEKSDDFQEMIISLTGGHIYDSLICQLGYLTNLQDTKKADKEFLKLVDLAFDKAPNNENGSLITILRKTGERFSFPLRQDEEDNQKAIEVFKKGVEFLEQNSSLEESMNNNDLNLLFFKDYLRMNLDYLGEKDEASKLASEIEPYEEYISWRQDFNLSEM